MCVPELHNTLPGGTEQALLLSKISLQKRMWLMRAVPGPWARLSSATKHRPLIKHRLSLLAPTNISAGKSQA